MTTFKRGDIVVGRDTTYSTEEHFGVVERDMQPGGLFLRAELVTGPNSTSFMAPGFSLDLFRVGTAEEIAAAPKFFQDWLERERQKEELRLLNQRDPIVSATNSKANATLRAAGINRVSDLARFSDKELLTLDGIRRTFVQKWLHIQAQKQEVAE